MHKILILKHYLKIFDFNISKLYILIISHLFKNKILLILKYSIILILILYLRIFDFNISKL